MNLGTLGGAAIVWVLVALIVTTRDPVTDPLAGFIGAALIGLAVAADARRRSRGSSCSRATAGSPIAATGPGPRGGAAGSASSSRSSSCCGCRSPSSCRSPCSSSRSPSWPRRPCPRIAEAPGRPTRPTRYDRRPTNRQPGGPLPVVVSGRIPRAACRAVKADVAAAVEAARDEIIDLSHRIHANPEPAFEEHQAATWIAEVLRGARLRGRAPGGQPRDRDPRDVSPGGGAAAMARGSGSSPSTTRCPASATAAATTRWRHRASARPSPSRRSRIELPRRDRVPRHARRGAGERQADHDRRRPVRRHRRGAAVPPVRPEPRRDPPARVGGRRRRVHRAPGARRRPIRGAARTRSTR